jgi:hypothetical protein
MPHTSSRYQQDLGFTDGAIFLGAGDLIVNVPANAPLTRIGQGNWAYNQVASTTTIFAANLTNALARRLGFGEDLQEQFGGAGIPGSAQPQFYRPDQNVLLQASAQQLLPRTALKTKGFKLLSIDVIYQTTVLALTSITIGVSQTVFANNVALANTVVLAAAANGLLTAVPSTGPNVINVPLAAAQQIYRISADMQLWVELTIVTPATSLCSFWGFDCKLELNSN